MTESAVYRRVVAETCKEFNLTMHELRSPRRNDDLMLARQVLTLLLCEFTDMTNDEIRECLNRKGKNMAIYYRKVIKEAISVDTNLSARVDKIKKAVRI